MRRSEAEAIALAGGAQARDLVLGLLEQVTLMRAEIDELKRQAGRSSANSSMPPGSDPPKSRAERRALARQAYKRSMRSSGAQPGHEGRAREMVAPERVDRRVEHLPEACECGHCFDGSEERVGDPVCHQQYELPVIVPLIFEHARVRLCCPACGGATLASLSPGDRSGFGPRIDAHIAMLAGVFRLSREQVRQVLVEIFAIPASKGSVDSAIMRMSRMLADPWSELRHAVQQAQVVHADETSWRLKGATQWLWVAASSLAACFRIDAHRSRQAAKELLGEEFAGFLVSDRYAAYHFLDVLQQQLCWCHAVRQFQEIAERPGVTGQRGRRLVVLAKQVLGAHREFLAENHDAAWLTETLTPLRTEIHDILTASSNGRHVRSANFAAGLLEEYDALWTFCDVPDLHIEPTNNAAERAVRHAVLARRIQGGTQSQAGNRWIERIQTVRETCRLQHRPVLAYLIAAAAAAHQSQPVPSLVPI